MKTKHQTKTRGIGSFTVTSGKLIISDPLYSIDASGGSTVLEDVADGEWHSRIETFNFGDKGFGGERIVSFSCIHEDPREFEPTDCDEFIEDLLVDSGQMSIFDSSEFGDSDSFYNSCCNATGHSGRASTVRGGAVVSSGFGDGVYWGYYYKNPDDKICAIFIVFIDLEEFMAPSYDKPFDVKDYCDKTAN